MKIGREDADQAEARTPRYQETYDRILNAAAVLINSEGARGMTFASVADAVGLNTTSVTYYFKRKEQLALACYDRTMARYEAYIDSAASSPTVADRVAAFFAAAFEDLRAVREGKATPHALLLELRTLEEPAKHEALARYRLLFGKLRGLLGVTQDPLHHARLTGQANILAENLFWLPFWIDRYDVADFPRVQARLVDILLHGIAARGAIWHPGPPRRQAGNSDGAAKIAQDDFLRAATYLINERSYRGASVERIAAHLNVTKGSFYHHLDAKDDLVESCFRRSFQIMTDSQFAAEGETITGWQGINRSVAALLHRQFDEEGALLRSSALQALPPAVRAKVVAWSNRVARRYSGLLADGIADGSIRPVDPLIAAQTIMALVNSAYDLRWWAQRLTIDAAVSGYGGNMAFGLLREQ